MNDELGFTIDTEQASTAGSVDLDGISYLATDLYTTMKRWHYLRVALIENKTATNNNSYLSVFFIAQDESFKVRENYFDPANKLKPLVRAIGLKVASRKSELLGKSCWCKLGVRTVGDRDYVTIQGFADSEPPENNIVGNGVRSDNQGGEIPF